MGKPDVLQHKLSQDEAIKLAKKAIMGIPMGILSAKNNVLKAGTPGMIVTVTIKDGTIEVDSSAMGNMLRTHVVSAIETALDEAPASAPQNVQANVIVSQPAVEMPAQTVQIMKKENPLEKRIEIFLEDGLFEKAEEYCEKLLDEDPENAKAYLGKIMTENKIQRKDQLHLFYKNNKDALGSNPYFKRFVRYASEEDLAIILEFSTCPKCGAKIDSEMNFCGKCGTKLEW